MYFFPGTLIDFGLQRQEVSQVFQIYDAEYLMGKLETVKMTNEISLINVIY